MVKRVLGVSLSIIGYFGYIYFRFYNGAIIPASLLFEILSLFLIPVGVGLFLTSKTKKQKQTAKDLSKALIILKTHGEKIQLIFENCLFKINDFEKDINDEGISFFSSSNLFDALYVNNGNYKTETINQTLIVYNNKNGNTNEKFISQIFPIDDVTLKYKVTNGDIILYVDRYNRKNYYFDLKK